VGLFSRAGDLSQLCRPTLDGTDRRGTISSTTPLFAVLARIRFSRRSPPPPRSSPAAMSEPRRRARVDALTARQRGPAARRAGVGALLRAPAPRSAESAAAVNGRARDWPDPFVASLSAYTVSVRDDLRWEPRLVPRASAPFRPRGIFWFIARRDLHRPSECWRCTRRWNRGRCVVSPLVSTYRFSRSLSASVADAKMSSARACSWGRSSRCRGLGAIACPERAMHLPVLRW